MKYNKMMLLLYEKQCSLKKCNEINGGLNRLYKSVMDSISLHITVTLQLPNM